MSDQTQSDRIKEASRKRRERQKTETRQAIIDAASELFLEQGYDNFSLRQVAEQIGYSPGTIYLYFDDKDHLLFTIADIGFERFGSMLQAAVDAGDDIQTQLEGMFRAYVAFGLQNPVHYRLMFIERTDFMLRDNGKWIKTFHILKNTVERGIETGVLPQGDAQSISDAFWAMVHGIVALSIRMSYIERERIDNAVEQSILILRNSLYKK